MLFFLNHCFCRCSGAQEAISSSLGKRRDGRIRENDDGDALNWALGEGRVSGCPLVREWAPSLPGLPLQSPLVKLFNRKTRANDFYQCAFLAPVSLLCLNSHSASSCFDRLNGILEKNTVAQLHRQWVFTSQLEPKIVQCCTYQPMASFLFIYFPGSRMQLDINRALVLETACDYTDNKAPLSIESRSTRNARRSHRLFKYFSNCRLGVCC